MKRKPLSKQEELIWGILLRHAEDYGVDNSPTRQEIGDTIGSSKQWVEQALQNMRKKGYVRFVPNKNRNIRIIELTP